MPNYCYNNLNVVGNPEHGDKEIVEFCLKYCSPDDDDPNATLDLRKTFKVDFDKVIPMPKFIEEPDFPYELKDDEIGMGFQGELIGSNGEITSNKSWEFVEDDEDEDDDEDDDHNETNDWPIEKEQS